MAKPEDGQAAICNGPEDKEGKEKSYDEDEDMKAAAKENISEDVCLVRKIMYFKQSDSTKICAGCSRLREIMKNHELSTKIGQCALCQNFGPSGHKCHYTVP
jgi:hypothetical protein